MASNVSRNYMSSFFNNDDLKNIEKLYNARFIKNKENAPKKTLAKIKKSDVLTSAPLRRHQDSTKVSKAHKEDRVVKSSPNKFIPKRTKYDTSIESSSHSINPEVCTNESASHISEEIEVTRETEVENVERQHGFAVPKFPTAQASKPVTCMSKLISTIELMSQCGLFSKEEISYHLGCFCNDLLNKTKKLYNKNPIKNAHVQLQINDLYEKNILDKNKFSLNYDGDFDIHSTVSGSTMPFFNQFLNHQKPYIFGSYPGHCRNNSFMPTTSEFGYPMFGRPYAPSEFGEPSFYRPFGRPYDYNQERMDYMPHRRFEVPQSEAFYRQNIAQTEEYNRESSLYQPFRRPNSIYNQGSMFRQPSNVPCSEASFRPAGTNNPRVDACQSRLMTGGDGPSRRMDFSRAGPSSDSVRKNISTLIRNKSKEVSHFQNQDSSLFAKPSSTLLPGRRANFPRVKTPQGKNSTNREVGRNKAVLTNIENLQEPKGLFKKRKRESSTEKSIPVSVFAPRGLSGQSSILQKNKSKHVLNSSNSLLNVSVTRSGRVSKPPTDYWSTH